MNKGDAMLTAEQALDSLFAAVRPISDCEAIPTLAANRRVLADMQTSQLDVPSMDNSQMDGYAVRSADCSGDLTRLRISQRIAAGHVGVPLQAGTAARIFTGAMLPDGADAVVMQEACEFEKTDDGEFVTIKLVPQAGDWIRRTGEDIRAGSMILASGTRLRAQELGLAASVGIASLSVIRKLRVAVFFTGDELVMPGEPLKPGAVYNSNRFLLRGLLENLGCDISDLGIVPDSLAATREALRRAAQHNDVIITSGGVSMGEADYIKPAVEAEGRLNMWQIAIKPGKPLAFGEIDRAGHDDRSFFFGLPGNPVSSFVTFLLFVRPFMLRLQGVQDVAPKVYRMRADFSWPKADRRNEFLRARINAEGGLDLFPNQGSAVLTSTAWGDGLIDNPPQQTISPGDSVRFIPFSELLY
jgi:molybdopterin molybdotransferase